MPVRCSAFGMCNSAQRHTRCEERRRRVEYRMAMTMVRPGPTVRREDVPLHDDVRWLAAALGRVIRRLEGESAFDTVESLRRACRARRRGAPDAPSLDQLLEQVEALPIEHIAVT